MLKCSCFFENQNVEVNKKKTIVNVIRREKKKKTEFDTKVPVITYESTKYIHLVEIKYEK